MEAAVLSAAGIHVFKICFHSLSQGFPVAVPNLQTFVYILKMPPPVAIKRIESKVPTVQSWVTAWWLEFL